jgi:predicted transcriptional regulator
MSEVNKIANYNQMMSWLTRPSVPKTETREDFAIGGGQFEGTDLGTREGFSKYSGSNYVKKLVTPEFLKASGTSLQDLTAAERKLFREGDLFFTKMKGKGGKVGVNFFGDSQKIDTLLGTVPDDISNLPDELSGKSVTAQKIRKRFIEEYLKELPKGDVINLDATTRMLDEKISEATNGKIRMKDKTALQNFLNDKKLNTNKVRGPKNVAEAKDIQMKKYPSIDKFDDVQKQADELNAKYKLDDKGIKFMARETSTGKVGMRLSFTGEPFKNAGVAGGRSLDAAPTAEGISKLETELKEIIKTDAFKNYSAKKAQTIGSVASGEARLKYNQDKLFDILLNSEKQLDENQIKKIMKYDEGTMKNGIQRLYQNIYLQASNPEKGGFLKNYSYDDLRKVGDNIKNLPTKYYDRTFENLLVDAYGDDTEKFKPLLNKVKKFREVQKKLDETPYGKFFKAEFDHIIPFSFLKQVKEGADPENLIRVKAYPKFLNSPAFKGRLDQILNKATTEGDQKTLKVIKELRSFLPEDLGEISRGRKISDFGAEPFSLKTIYTNQQKKFGEVYDRTFEFLDRPEVKKILGNLGVTFRAIGQARKLNAPGFVNSFNKMLKENPDLRVQLEDTFGDEYKDIENQLASASMMSDVSPVRKEQEPENVPAEAIAAGTVGATKYGPQILKALKNVGKVGLKTVGSLPAAGTFAGMTIKENLDEGKNIVDATVDPLVGLELLLPETVKKLGPLMARAARVSTPVGATITGLGTLKDRTLGMMEAADALTMQDYQEDLVDEYAAKRYRGYELGGRVGFADGPEDPDKRKFMKIMGGLASIPILGRFIDIGTQAPKVAEVVKRTAEGVPAFLTDLIAKVKLKATEKGTKYFTGNRSDEFADVYQADNFVVTEKGNKTTIREVDDPDRPGYRENQIEIEVDPETGGVTYNEASARPDMDGKLKDVDEYIEDDDLENMRKYTYDK